MVIYKAREIWLVFLRRLLLQYYLDEKGGLWKKDKDYEHYYFSRNTGTWIKCQGFFILPDWDYDKAISKKDGKMVLKDYKKDFKER